MPAVSRDDQDQVNQELGGRFIFKTHPKSLEASAKESEANH